MQVIENPAWNLSPMDRPRERPFGSVRTIPSLRDQPQETLTPPSTHEFRLRVHDHDEHQFEPPTSPLPEKPQPFIPGKHHYLPIATPTIIIATIVVFILMMYSNNCPAHRMDPSNNKACVGKWLHPLSFQPWSENPILGPRRTSLLKYGALESTRVRHRGEGWRLLSAMFLNGGVLQLIINVLALLVVGLRMEFAFSFSKLFAVYVLSGFGGSVLSALMVQNQVFAGASSAVMGLIGASVADMIVNLDVTSRVGLKVVDLMLFALIGLGLGLVPQVDNFANLGGFFTGLLLGFVLLLRPQRGYKDTRHLSQLEAYVVNNEDTDLPPVAKYKRSQRVLQAVAGVLLVGLLVAGCVLLFIDRKVNRSCHWCHYMACVPNLKWTCPGPY